MLFQALSAKGKIPHFEGIEFLRLDLPGSQDPPFARVWYTINGTPASRALRLDISNAEIIDLESPRFGLTKDQWLHIRASIPALVAIVMEARGVESRVCTLTRERLSVQASVDALDLQIDALQAQRTRGLERIREIDSIIRKGIASCE